MISSMETSDSPARSFVLGGCGCLGLVLLGAVFLVAIGGHVRLDVGGALALFVIGGLGGLALNSAYRRGVEAGRREAGAEPVSGLPEGYGGVTTPRPRPFIRPWGPTLPLTVEEALVQAASTFVPSEGPSLRESPSDTRLELRASQPGVGSVVTVIASNESDALTVEIDDELGKLVAPTPSWRGAAADGAGFIQAMEFVKAYLVDSFAHAVTGEGEHRLVAAQAIPELVRGDQRLRVRSWLGTLDRGAMEED